MSVDEVLSADELCDQRDAAIDRAIQLEAQVDRMVQDLQHLERMERYYRQKCTRLETGLRERNRNLESSNGCSGRVHFCRTVPRRIVPR